MIKGKTKTIIDALKTQILNGKFDERHPLPSERALMQRFGAGDGEPGAGGAGPHGVG